MRGLVAVGLLGFLLAGSARAEVEPFATSVLVLDVGASNGALNLGGQNQLLVRKGDLVVNSSHNMAIFNANSTIKALAGQVQVVGGCNNLGEATTEPEAQTGATGQADPLGKLEYPQVTDVQSRQKMFVSGDKEVTLSPGYYAGGLSLTGKGLKVTLEPGMYVITDGDFFISDAEVSGTGVTIVMSGQTPGKLLWATGARIALSAPAEGALKDILIVSAGRLNGANTDVGLNGCAAILRGTIYAPLGRVGVYFNSKIITGRVICYQLMMNTSAVLDVMGVPVDSPDWDKQE